MKRPIILLMGTMIFCILLPVLISVLICEFRFFTSPQSAFLLNYFTKNNKSAGGVAV